MTEHTDIAGVERRLQDVPGFLAFERRRYHELTGVEPSEDFDLPPEALTALGICRRPRPEAYAADTHAIAARVGVPTAGLANFLRGIDALTALTQRPASSTASRHEPQGMLVAARDHAEEQTDLDDVGSEPILPGWLSRAIARFWGQSDLPGGFPRDLHLPVLLNLPLAIIEIDGLTVASLDDWLQRHQLPEFAAAVVDRPLRGCLTAYAGVGVVFVDRSDDDDQRRLTLAHEAGHFVIDYLMPRELVIARRPDLLDVLDGERPPTDAEQFGALLSDVPIGFHSHLLERDVHGGHLTTVTTGVEDRAERMALELLAPLAEVTAEADRRPETDLTRLLLGHFGLPAGAATRYANHLRLARPSRPRSLFDAMGLTPDKDTDPQE
jgi:hypothetical protein